MLILSKVHKLRRSTRHGPVVLTFDKELHKKLFSPQELLEIIYSLINCTRTTIWVHMLFDVLPAKWDNSDIELKLIFFASENLDRERRTSELGFDDWSCAIFMSSSFLLSLSIKSSVKRQIRRNGTPWRWLIKPTRKWEQLKYTYMHERAAAG